MKKTKYFIGREYGSSDAEDSIVDANKQKEEFIKMHQNEIGEIDNETLQFITFGNNSLICKAIIQVVYYPKK